MAWLMVGQACFCAWTSVRGQGKCCGNEADLGPGTLVSLLFAWCAFAQAGDCVYHRWMMLVKCAGIALYGLAGTLLLAFGGQPKGQAFVLAVSALWIAFVFAQPKRESSHPTPSR